jgi:hypothetical protein
VNTSNAAMPAAYGWADFFVVPAAPGSTVALPEAFIFRGIHRYGSASNDAATDPQGALGDVFVCPCPINQAKVAAGLPPPIITEQLGVFTEAAGVYVHDGVECEWQYDYFPQLKWTVVTLTTAVSPEYFKVYNSRLEQLYAVSRRPAISGVGAGCSIAPCNLVTAASTGDPVSLYIPGSIKFIGNSPRSLNASYLARARNEGRFSILFEQSSNLPSGLGQRAMDMAAASSTHTSNLTLRHYQHLKSMHSASKVMAVAKNLKEGLKRQSEIRKSTDVLGINAGALLLAITSNQGEAAPCRFARGPTTALVRYNISTF